METTTVIKKPRKKKVLVKRKRDRLQLITDLIKTNCIGSQSELADMLREHNINVTQATNLAIFYHVISHVDCISSSPCRRWRDHDR